MNAKIQSVVIRVHAGLVMKCKVINALISMSANTLMVKILVLYPNLAKETPYVPTFLEASLSSRWVCLSKNLVLQYILESLSSLLFHSLMSEWIADHFCWPFLSRLFPTNQNKAGQKRREEKCGGKQCAKKLVSNFHSLISEWKRRDDKLSSIYWRTRFLLRHTQPDDRLEIIPDSPLFHKTRNCAIGCAWKFEISFESAHFTELSKKFRKTCLCNRWRRFAFYTRMRNIGN